MIPVYSKPVHEKGGQCLDKIANILNAIENPCFKVDQRSICDRLKKLLKFFVAKGNTEDKASSIPSIRN